MKESGMAVGAIEIGVARNLLHTQSGKGKEIADYLRRELGLPEKLISFEVKFERQELITVTCVYYPTERKESVADMPPMGQPQREQRFPGNDHG